MLSIFNRVGNDNIGEFDWNPYIPFVSQLIILTEIKIIKILMLI